MKSQLSSPNNWHVVYTWPNYEKKVDQTLQRNAITTFLPVHKVPRKWSDRTKMVEVPLFPNYLFVRLSEGDRFRVLDTPGVKCYITSGGRPVVVNEEEIGSIKRMVESKSVILEHNLAKGDCVRICDGPFRNLKGVLFERMGQSRFCVRIESINQVLSIEVSTALLERVKN